MKIFAYFTILFASIGSVYVAATNPGLVQQGAVMLGLSNAATTAEDEPENHQLAKFLADYPYAVQETSAPEPELPKIELPQIEPSPVSKEDATKIDPPVTAQTVEPMFPPLVPPVESEQPEFPPIVGTKTEPSVVTDKQPPVDPSMLLSMAPVPNEVPYEESGFATSKNAKKTEEPRAVPMQRTALIQPFDSQPRTEPPPVAVAEPAPEVANQWNGASETLAPVPLPELTPPSVPPTEQAVPTPADPFLQSGSIVEPPVAHNAMWNVENKEASAAFPSAAPPPVVQPILQQEKPQETNEMIPAVPTVTVANNAANNVTNNAQQYHITPSIVSEEVPCHGTELVARVGTEVILMCDILPQLRRIGQQMMREKLEKLSEEERKQVPEEEQEKYVNMFVESQYPAFLQDKINVALIYNDFTANKAKEEIDFFVKKFNDEFDEREIPVMLKEFNAANTSELKRHLNAQLGSSLDRERMLWVRSKLAQQWVMSNIQGASGECTHDEMMEFYKSHQDMFTSQARVEWKEVFVAFANHKTEQEAQNKIAWMGNQIVAGYSFEDIARVNSEGFTASKGGHWEWTQQGALSSPELENALFTMEVNRMSPIINGSNGLHIVQVLRREETSVMPFIEAQVTIREQIKMQRRKKYETEYFNDLRRRYPTSILRDKIDFRLK